MAVRLRAHHLLCMLTYVGKGYSDAFVARFDALAARLSEGEPILVVDGPDDVCAAILDAPGAHCRTAGVALRDGHAARQVGAVLGTAVGAGAVLRLEPERFGALRRAFASGAARQACAGCEWESLCTAVAGTAFAGARVSRDGPSDRS